MNLKVLIASLSKPKELACIFLGFIKYYNGYSNEFYLFGLSLILRSESRIIETLIVYKLLHDILSQILTLTRGLGLSLVLKSSKSLVSVSKCMTELDT